MCIRDRYRVIYEIIDDIKAAILGLLEPKYEEAVLGQAEIRKIFKVSKVGAIAGSYAVSYTHLDVYKRQGAYICPNPDCWQKALKSKGFEKSLRTSIPADIMQLLKEKLEEE